MFYNSEYITRIINCDKPIVYLTFDDGPDPLLTPKVLALLKKNNIAATFFVIANKAQKHPEIVKKIINDGHAIGNHSLDHNYCAFFYNFKKMTEWVVKAEEILEQITGAPTVGFRSPAGVVNKKLIQVLQKLNMPLYHWNIRFYDTKFELNEKKIDKACSELVPGSIILLHDSHKLNPEVFLIQLEKLINKLLLNGYTFAKI